MSNHEDTARHYATKRPGYELVSYREVITPLFKVTVRALTLVRRDLPVVAEFILKAIGEGIDTSQEIAALLGVEDALVNSHMQLLVSSDDVMVGPSSDGRKHRLFLTSKGRVSLTHLKLEIPEESYIPVYIDGISHEILADMRDEYLLKPWDLQGNELPELDVYPHLFKPSLPEMRTPIMTHLQNSMGAKDEVKRRDILEIIGIERVEPRFRGNVLALVYKSIDTSQPPAVSFAIDGVVNEIYERHVSRGDAVKRLGLIPKDLDSAEEELKSVLGEKLVADAPPSQETSPIITQTATVSDTVRRLQERIEKSDSQSEKALLKAQLQEAREQLAKLQADRDAYQVRMVECFDHRQYLMDALANAEERVMIISRWIRGNVVNNEFFRLLRTRISKKVEIYIGYGYPYDDESKNDRDVVRDLRDLSNRHPNFHFKKLGNTHAKILVCDHKFVIVTSFNWLSFRGDPTRTFRDERGFFVSLPEKIDEFFNDYASQIKVT